MRPLRLFAPLALTTTLLATACGGTDTPADSSSDTPASTSPAASSAGTPAGATAAAEAADGAADDAADDAADEADDDDDTDALKANCSSAPADLVSAVLGDTVSAPKETRNGPNTVTCAYDGPKVGHLTIRIRIDQTAAGFADGKKASAGQGATATDLPGFADKAYSVAGSGANQATTVAALMGSNEIVVTAKSTVSVEKDLVSEVLTRTQP